jgi:hypothetical protein
MNYESRYIIFLYCYKYLTINVFIKASCYSIFATKTWLTAMEYLCHKWPRICSTCRKHFPVLSSSMTYHRVCNYINTTGATSEAGTTYHSIVHEFTPGFIGVRVTRSLVLYVCFVDRCLSLCSFSFSHCVVCPCSTYGFWLLLWYLQTLLH